jgi:proline dehydrogenase
MGFIRRHREDAFGNAHEETLTYLHRFESKKLLSGEERVAERVVYSRFFDTEIGDRSVNRVDELLVALKDKRLKVSIHAVAKAQASIQLRHQP